jgi:uncharacterized protein
VLGGGAGFGYALLSAPFLLLLGFSPPFVVTANVSLGLIARIGVAYRFRIFITRRRVGLLLLGSLPGLVIGVQLLTSVDTSTIKVGTGAVAILTGIALIWSTSRHGEPWPIPGGAVLAGFAGGLMSATTSISGVPPAIYFIRERLPPANFLGDMAAFFVGVNALALLTLFIGGAIVPSALFPAALLWLPGAVIGNLVGARIGARLPRGVFRYFTLGVVLIAGVITIVTA